MNIIRSILTLVAAAQVCLCIPQASAREVRDTVTLQFRQSKTDFDPEYMGNARHMEIIREKLRIYTNPDSSYSLKSVRVLGTASPEGSVAINRELSEGRARRIFEEISKSIFLPDSLTEFRYEGRDWRGLQRLASTDTSLPYQSETLQMIQDIVLSISATGSDTEENLMKLKRLRGGVPYRYMLENIFPDLRGSRLEIRYESFAIPAVTICPDSPYVPATILIPDNIEPTTTWKHSAEKKLYVDIRSNLIYDAAALPTLGAEIYIGKNWSIIGNWTYGWWKNDKKHRYWRAYGGDIGARRWFGKSAYAKPLTGHHAGIYLQVLTYDFEFGGKGYMGGIPKGNIFDRCHWGGGVEYGYSLPVKKRLNLDFTLGLGYLGGEYREYLPKDNHYVWQATKRRHYFGPTKAEISLVWLIGHGNENEKKGGSHE